MTETSQERGERIHNELEQLIRDDVLKEIKSQYNDFVVTTLYGSNFSGSSSYKENGDKYILVPNDAYDCLMKKPPKKIKRRLYYDVWYWSIDGYRLSKYFESAKKAKKYVNYIHNSGLMKDGDYVRLEKTFCYRQYHPKHKWYYVSPKPDVFICVEKW